MELSEIKQFLKIDSNDQDAVLTAYQSAAEQYLTNTGITKDYTNALYKVAVVAITGAMLENPTILDIKSENNTSGIAFNAIITQLRICQTI